MIVVVDASVVIQWYFPEEHTVEAETLLSEGVQLNAPELLLPEIANVLWKKFKAGEVTAKEAEMGLALFRSRQVVLHKHARLLKTALSGAIETEQPVYDWVYLALALALSCPFVTADRRFFRAMRTTRFKNQVTWIENVESVLR